MLQKQKGQNGLRWLARASTGTVAEALFWSARYFEVGDERLLYWSDSLAYHESSHPEGSFTLSEVDDVAVQDETISIHFSVAQRHKTRRAGRSRTMLCLRAEAAFTAELWAESLRNAVARCLKQAANDLPTEWDVSNMLNQKTSSARLVARVPLPRESVMPTQRLMDYAFICKSTKDRRGQELPMKLDVVEVVGVQNATAWTEYVKSRTDIKMAVKSRVALEPEVRTLRIDDAIVHGFFGEVDMDANERWLFHGTTPDAVRNITDSEFRIDMAGSNRGTMYGKGLYFAECSSKADEYSEVGLDGVCTMLICRVTLGNIAVNTDKSPDAKDLTSMVQSGGYNSVLGDRWTAVGTFREFIVYDSAQVYPAYIVFYKRRMQSELLTELRAAAELGDTEHCESIVPYMARVAERHPSKASTLALYLLFDAHATVIVPLLVRSLQSDLRHVRKYSLKALQELAPRIGTASANLGAASTAVVPDLLACLDTSYEDAARQAAAKALGQLKARAAAAVPALISCTIDASADMRLAAATSLGQIGSPAIPGMPALTRCATDSHVEVRKAATYALGRFSLNVGAGHAEYASHAAEAVRVLTRCLEDPVEELRRAAAWSIGEFGAQATLATTALVDCLITDADEATRRHAATSLGKLGMFTSPLVPALVECLSNAHEQTREGACVVLGRLGGHALLAMPALVGVLNKDSKPSPRVAAATSLGQLGASAVSTVDVMMNGLRHACDDVREACARALGQIAPHTKDAEKLVVQLLADLSDKEIQDVREASAMALGFLRAVIGPHAGSVVRSLMWVLLMATDERPRAAAAGALGRLGLGRGALDVSPAAPVLTETLKEYNLRGPCAKALGRLGKQAAWYSRVFPGLVDCLKDRRDSVRTIAAKSIGLLGQHADGVAALLIEKATGITSTENVKRGREDGATKQVFADVGLFATATVSEQRQALSMALEQLGSRSRAGVAVLASLLRNKRASASYRAPLVSMLAKIAMHDVATAVPVLVECLKDNSEFIRKRACRAFGDLGQGMHGDIARERAPIAVNALIEVLSMDAHGEDDEVRPAAATAIASYGSWAAPAVPVLTSRFKDKNHYLRQAAVTAVGKLKEHGASAAPEIVKRLKDRKPYVREAAWKALAHMGSSADYVVKSIVEVALDPSSGDAQAAAVAALGAFHRHAPELVTTISSVLESSRWEARKMAIGALRKFGMYASTEVPSLLECINDSDENVRIASAKALGQIGWDHDMTLPTLLESAKSPYENTREAAVVALGELGEHAVSAVPTLLECLKDQHRVRVAAVSALGMVATTASDAFVNKVLAQLVECLQDKNKYIRIAVCEALLSLSTSVFPAPALFVCLRDESERVRNTALEALVKIGTSTVTAPPLFGTLLRNSTPSADSTATRPTILGDRDHAAQGKRRMQRKTEKPVSSDREIEPGAWKKVSVRRRASGSKSGAPAEAVSLDLVDSCCDAGSQGESGAESTRSDSEKSTNTECDV